MKENENPNSVKCPLIDATIEAIDCITVVDSVDGLMKDTAIGKKFKSKEAWKEICQNCENRKYQD